MKIFTKKGGAYRKAPQQIHFNLRNSRQKGKSDLEGEKVFAIFMLLFLPQMNFYSTVQTEVCFQTSCWFKGAADLESVRVSSTQTVSMLTRGNLFPRSNP